ncbi:MAG: hypothetical protein A2X82_19530 [Geobacteraceae bacterium GWC2_55_20]|nr:MAG: hypothetical protein A2X82_19530 [Geobacteraceae bacterium GWC2_55_20]OGU23107.1 MAG: hypothetical protein A2X85_10780 [Geobacteraceae bacterium GWF2_54_21]HCE66035.1 hypothetical protein [Geobacter sp.]
MSYGKKRIQAAKQRRSSFQATWNAIWRFSFHHFPQILPGVHPLLAPLIMFRLKRRGFSNCRVEVTGNGLVVHAVK